MLNQALFSLFSKIFYTKKPRRSGAPYALIIAVPVCLVVIAVAEGVVVKGKFADFIVAGAVKIEDVGLEVIREGFDCFRLASRVASVFRPAMAA